MNKFLILCILIVDVSSLLRIDEGPDNLMDIYQHHTPQYEIKYQLSPFGEIPYEKTIFSELKLAEPLDGCKPMKKLYENDELLPFVLIARGNCSYGVKVANA